MDLEEPALSLPFQAQAYLNWWVIRHSVHEPDILVNQGSSQDALRLKNIQIKQNRKGLGMLPKLKSPPWYNPQSLAEVFRVAVIHSNS